MVLTNLLVGIKLSMTAKKLIFSEDRLLFPRKNQGVVLSNEYPFKIFNCLHYLAKQHILTLVYLTNQLNRVINNFLKI